MGIEREGDSIGYEARKALFERREAEVAQHNLSPDRLWTAAVNKFADFSDAEFQALLGHRPGVHRSSAASVSMLDLGPAKANLPTSVDLTEGLSASFKNA